MEGDQIKEDEMGRECSTHGKNEKCAQKFGEKHEEKRPLGRTGRRWENNKRIDLREIG
jgi:hypothetical protein